MTVPLQAGSTAALQLGFNWVKSHSPHHLHARSRYRQTDTQHLFQPRCRVIPKSQPLTNMPSAEFSAWGVTRPQQRSSYRAASPAGRYFGNPDCDLLNQQAQFNSNTQNYHAAPLCVPMMVGPTHVQTGDPTFPIPSPRQMMHHTTSDQAP